MLENQTTAASTINDFFAFVHLAWFFIKIALLNRFTIRLIKSFIA